MSFRTIILLLALFGLTAGLANDSHAQTRKTYALFISGYGEGVWTDSGTPQDWKNRGIIDDYAILDGVVTSRLDQLSNIEVYSVSDLRTYLGSRTDELIYDLTSLYVKGANADVIVVGHSAGGFLARALTSIVDNYGIPLAYGHGNWKPNILTVTLATPHQGARVFNKSGSTTAGIIDGWVSTVERPTGDRCRGVTWYLSLTNRSALDQVRALGGQLDEASKLLQYGAGYFDGSNAIVPYASALKPGGRIVRGVNRLPNPSDYLSVYGAEKSRTIVRLASELPFAGSYQGNEKSIYGDYEDLRKYYAAQRDCWNAAAAAYYSSIFLSWKGPGARKKANRWKEGERRLKAVDDMWVDAIDSYFTETRTGTRQVQVCYPSYRGGGGATPILLSQDEIPGLREQQAALRECSRYESPYRYETYTYTVRVETKNDGIMGPQYGTWKKSQMSNFNTNATGSGSNGNAYYSDVPSDGGYNHMEIRRSKRAYSTSAFKKGDQAPPFRGIESWKRARLR